MMFASRSWSARRCRRNEASVRCSPMRTSPARLAAARRPHGGETPSSIGISAATSIARPNRRSLRSGRPIGQADPGRGIVIRRRSTRRQGSLALVRQRSCSNLGVARPLDLMVSGRLGKADQYRPSQPTTRFNDLRCVGRSCHDEPHPFPTAFWRRKCAGDSHMTVPRPRPPARPPS